MGGRRRLCTRLIAHIWKTSKFRLKYFRRPLNVAAHEKRVSAQHRAQEASASAAVHGLRRFLLYFPCSPGSSLSLSLHSAVALALLGHTTVASLTSTMDANAVAKDKEDSIKLLVAAQAHLGTKNMDLAMSDYVWRRRA